MGAGYRDRQGAEEEDLAKQGGIQVQAHPSTAFSSVARSPIPLLVCSRGDASIPGVCP